MRRGIEGPDITFIEEGERLFELCSYRLRHDEHSAFANASDGAA